MWSHEDDEADHEDSKEEKEWREEREGGEVGNPNAGNKRIGGAYAVKRAHWERPAATAAWRRMNERLQDHWPDWGGRGGVTHRQKHPASRQKQQKVQTEKQVCLQSFLPDTHGRSHTLPEPASLPSPPPPTDRIRKTFSGVCEAAPHTKKHLGTGLVGLQRIHICPVQAIGIQSFTLSNATKREQSQPELFFALAAPLGGGGSFGGTTMRP